MQSNKIPIALISETFLKPQHKFKVRNYQVYRNDRINRRAGGTAILIHNSVEHAIVDPPLLHRIEATAVRLNIDRRPVTIISVYNPPNDIDIGDIEQLLQSSDSTILAGDFNAKHINWNCRQNNRAGTKLLDFYNNTNIQFQILSPDNPTLIPDNPRILPDILDIALTKNMQLHTTIDVLNELGSDHLPIQLTLTGHVTQPIARISLNYHQAHWDQFRNDIIANIGNNAIETSEDIENSVKSITSIIQKAIDANIPKRKQRENKQNYPPEIIELIKQRNNARRLWQRHHDNQQYKRTMNHLKFRIHLAIQEHVTGTWDHTLSGLDTRNMSEVWNITKKITKQQPRYPPLQTNNGQAITAREKNIAFANELKNTFSPNEIQNNEFTAETEELVYNYLNIEPRTKIRKTNEHELRWQIKHLKDKKAPGPDGIQNIILKELPKCAIQYIARIINAILETKHFPNEWKEARVLLFPKQGKNLSEPANYRPISLLNTMSKLTEKIIAKRLKHNIQQLKIIRDEQCGFRNSHSTTMQLMRHVENITKGYNENRATVALYLDIKQAFDKVWHVGLIRKMIENNIEDSLIHLINNYLYKRRFHSFFQNYKSETKNIESGVPQGSIIGPTLFNLYINDIPHLPQFNNSALHIFADDTLITGQSHRPIYAARQVQRSIALIEPWLERWRIQINPTKCQAIIYSKKRSHLNQNVQQIQINGQNINWAHEVKYLGVTLDQKLLFQRQIKISLRKAYGSLMKLYPLLNYNSKLNPHVGVVMYKALLRPIITYACPVWGHAAKTHINRLQIFQNKVLRIATKLPQCTPIRILHRETRTDIIQEFIKTSAMRFYYRTENHPNPLVAGLGNYDPIHFRHKRPKSLLGQDQN